MGIRGVLGRKIGMMSYFKENGECLAVTALQAGPCTVVQVRTPEKDGYGAVQLGFEPVREKALSRPELGQFKKRNLPPMRRLGEVGWDGRGDLKIGDKVGAELFENVSYVDVRGRTKGRGFAGVVRRWSFRGGPATHGMTDRERHSGALGRQGSVCGDVIKNKKMAGHYGDEQVTSKNLPVVKVMKEENVLLVHGSVPGPKGAPVTILISPKVKRAPPPTKTDKKKAQVVKKK